jgi:hypothetical protein
MLLLPRNFLTLPITRDSASVTAYRRPLGYVQVTPAITAAKLVLPTLPAGFQIGYAIIQCEGAVASARWRDDGTAPTSTVGMILSTGQELDYSGDLTMIQFIIAANVPILNISYYA